MIDFRKLKINSEAKFSITRPYEAKQIVKHIEQFLTRPTNSYTVTDGTAGVGGDVLNFSIHFHTVNAIEKSVENFNLLKENVQLSNQSNINLYHGDCIDIIPTLKQDILYLDPPWGGVNYKKKEKIILTLSNHRLVDIVEGLDCLVFLKLPFNADLSLLNIEEKFTILNKKNRNSFYLIKLKNGSKVNTPWISNPEERSYKKND